ncbi:hypothetical protein [Devosia sp.]|uniref:hypothetical protein n=1 Tax=Devosia sp. TaxID=1871048 RepID=UPI0035ADF885
MTILFIHSHYGPLPKPYEAAVASGRLLGVREVELTSDHFEAATGLITTTHLDQVGFLACRPALTRLLDRGGRWFFNGHMLRIFVEGLGIYEPIRGARRPDYVLTRLNPHAIFDGIEQRNLEENRGVAGFYGRGHNPLPGGGLAVNGIGPDLLPIDWEWRRPAGGRIFSHAGNDLGGMGGEGGPGALLAERVVSWCEGRIGS